MKIKWVNVKPPVIKIHDKLIRRKLLLLITEERNNINVPSVRKFLQWKKLLNSHFLSAHKGVKPYTCQIYGKSFLKEESLTFHFASVHEGKKPFKCPLYEMSFSLKTNVQKHVQCFHDKEKSFKCSKCEAMFVEKSNLNKLIQVMHDGRKFACEKCDTKFTSLFNLNRHVNSFHVKIKLYRCISCDKCFLTNKCIGRSYKS